MKHLFNEIVEQALKHHCSDIHLDIMQVTNISYRFQGQIYFSKQLNLDEGLKLFNYIIFKANMDIVNKNKVSSGALSYSYLDRDIYLRISIIPTFECDSMVIRILNNHRHIALKQLSIFTNHHKILNKIVTLNSGLVIFTGKTGSGKTTTLYALLEAIYKQTKKKIITLEDPIERHIEGLLQIYVNNDQTSFFDILKQVLRHDPDIIVIGEIRDANDLKLAVQASLSGHLVLTSMHAINSIFAINRLIELGINQSDLKATIQYISYQELYYNQQEVYTIYEFINNQQLIEYLTNQEVKYFKINDYITSLTNLNLKRGK
ncbi:MAG: ATPase, T2SS/T4P/T4SS family [Bacilli bacterium]